MNFTYNVEPFYFAQPYLFPAAAHFKVYLVLYILWAGSCTSELLLKVNCRPKVNCRIRFGLFSAKSWQTSPNFFLQFAFSLQFTFNCNSLVHDPALEEQSIKRTQIFCYTEFVLWVPFQLKRCWIVSMGYSFSFDFFFCYFTVTKKISETELL